MDRASGAPDARGRVPPSSILIVRRSFLNDLRIRRHGRTKLLDAGRCHDIVVATKLQRNGVQLWSLRMHVSNYDDIILIVRSYRE